MALPFTVEEFFEVFARYNAALWPAQVGAYLLGLAAFASAWRGGPRASAFVGATLGTFWAVAGGLYHLVFFRAITPIAVAAGLLFLLEAALLAIAGFRGQLEFGAARWVEMEVGAAFAAYAAVLYPAVNLASGHALSASPAFGIAPCPVTIFTLGVLLLAGPKVPLVLLPIPLLGSLVGISAAIHLRVPGDYGLGVAGVIATALLVARNRARPARAPASAA